jgi:anti-anti-sigma factor
MDNRSGHYWTLEGFLLDDLYNGTGIDSTVYADRHLLVTRTDDPVGLRFAGEIDVSNSAAVGRSIRVAPPDATRPHLDLSRLSFCDVSGIRELVRAALELGDERRLLLHGLPRQLQTVMRVTGFSNLPNILTCACGAAR